ncbi:Sodium/potassium-transporting ATPase subunit beta-2 [Gryllus bimaculatus]|nr:Sodium/potassium-transporting ATPase subunit beta-2 [Gryllus bimaculatus]
MAQGGSAAPKAPIFEPHYEFYLKPPEVGRWEAFRLFLYNPDKGQIFGRTGPSWAPAPAPQYRIPPGAGGGCLWWRLGVRPLGVGRGTCGVATCAGGAACGRLSARAFVPLGIGSRRVAFASPTPARSLPSPATSMPGKRYAFDAEPAPPNPFDRPPPKGAWQFFFDSERGTVLGRDGRSWAKIGLFYLGFYAVLAALFAVCLWVFFQTLDPRIPTWQLDSSIIGTSPGLGFRPMPEDSNVESTLIWYRGTDRDDFRQWTDTLDEFLAVYKTPGLTPGRGQNIHNCDYDKPPKKGQVCNVDIKNWHPCIQENHYNYHKSSPCIFIKLNKIYNWIPEYYNESLNLPEQMPDDLKQYIHNLESNNSREEHNVCYINPQHI